ncbi:MAG: TIM barrel protein [Candidatus Methanomethylophilaceae archaeon]|nr:TIM barrel protein [Candidatus Methanomethylophilaceae archaeon]
MRFGPAGYPSEGKTPKGALEYTRSLGLDALEVEFVRGARISPEKAEEVGAKAKELDIRLSCHAPYFISFNSDSEETRAKSVDWVTSTARAAHHLGAYLIVIHAASYGKNPETALQSVVDGLSKSKDVLDDEGIKDVILGVETMGKLGQFGTLDEIEAVMDQVDGVRPVLDVAHVHARGRGCLKTEDDMRGLVDKFFSLSGKTAHFHISCIKYGDKGEISHLPLEAKEPNLQMLADILNDSDQDCTFICESPLIEKDAVVFRDMFPKFRKRTIHSVPS